MKHETAGDPVSGLKWTRKTTEKIADELEVLDIKVSPNTVGRLLKEMDFSLRVNHKKIESGIKNPPDPDDRDQQFELIRELQERFAKEGNPTISVDTKKKEREHPQFLDEKLAFQTGKGHGKTKPTDITIKIRAGHPSPTVVKHHGKDYI